MTTAIPAECHARQDRIHDGAAMSDPQNASKGDFGFFRHSCASQNLTRMDRIVPQFYGTVSSNAPPSNNPAKAASCAIRFTEV